MGAPLMRDRRAAKRRPTPVPSEPASRDEVERLVRLRQQAERIVDEVFRVTPSAETPQGPRVPADVYEDGDQFLVSIELPGVRRADLSLFVVGQALVIEGEKREVIDARVAFECAERSYGAFRRVIELPGAADSGRIEARLEKGVLEVRLPRIRERRGRRREVPIG